MKSQINFRASAATAAELAQLVAKLGEGQTEVISRAIATLHQKYHDHMHFEIAQAEAGTCQWCGWQYEEPSFPELTTSPTWGGPRTPAGGRPTMKYAVYAEQLGQMILAEDGFLTWQEAGEWAAAEYGLGNWRVVPYEGAAPMTQPL